MDIYGNPDLAGSIESLSDISDSDSDSRCSTPTQGNTRDIGVQTDLSTQGWLVDQILFGADEVQENPEDLEDPEETSGGGPDFHEITRELTRDFERFLQNSQNDNSLPNENGEVEDDDDEPWMNEVGRVSRL